MAEPLDFEALVIENVGLQLDGVDYASALDSVLLVPTTAKTKWKPVNGRKGTRVALPDWVLTLNAGQSFNRAGLTAQLIENHGKRVPFVLTPEGDATSASKIEGFAILEAGQVGGASEAVATAGVSLDVDGQPKFTWRPDAAAAVVK